MSIPSVVRSTQQFWADWEELKVLGGRGRGLRERDLPSAGPLAPKKMHPLPPPPCQSSRPVLQAGGRGWEQFVIPFPPGTVSRGDPAHMPSLEAQAVCVRVHMRVCHGECCTASFSGPSGVRRGGSAACQDRTMVSAWLLPLCSAFVTF